MSDKSKQGGASPKNTGAPEPKDTTTTAGDVAAAGVTAPDAEAVEKQREDEAKAVEKAAAEEAEDRKVSAADKRAQTRAAKDVREEAKTDAEVRAGDAPRQGISRPEPDDTSGLSEVEKQRQEFLDERAKAEFGEAPDAEGDEALLTAAAPGGATTAVEGSKEGSTVVSQTAASPAPAGPLSGPLDPPQSRDVLNRAASEDDPDNRVYADEAGPRDVFEGTEATKARYVDADGNEVDYDGIFEDDGKSYVTAKQRVYETFIFPNTEVEGKRLAYAKGRRVPRGEAENVKRQISVHSPIV